MRNARLITAVWVAALAVPSAPGHAFDGIPFSHLAEWSALLAFALLFALGTSVPRRLAPVWIGVPVLLGGAKVALALAVQPLAFPACLHVPGVTAAGACERSFDAAPGDTLATRYDRALTFTPASWRLGALNSRRFDAIRSDAGEVPPVPFEMRWRLLGAFPSGSVEAAFCGGLTIADAAGRETFSGSSATPTRRAVALESRSVVTFASASCRDAPQLSLPVPRPSSAPVVPAVVDGAFAAAAAVAALLVLNGVLRRHAAAAAIVTAASLAIWALAPPATAERLLNVVMAAPAALVALGILAVPEALALVVLPLWCRLSRNGLGFDFVSYPSGFNDPLTYESFARDMLHGSILRGAEDVFYLQPFFRYARYLEHVIFGESQYAIVVFVTLAFFAGWLTLARVLAPGGDEPAPRRALRAAAGVALLLVCAGLIDAITFGISEYVAWAAIPLVYAWLYGRREPRYMVAAGALAGICVITRFNLLVPVGVLMAIAIVTFIRSAPRAAIGCALACAGVVLLPLLHNLWFGGSFTLLPTSALVSETVDIPFARLLTPWQPDVAAYLWRRAQLLLHVGAGHDLGGGLWLPGHALQVLFAAGFVYAVKHRVHWTRLALALVPLSALAVHVPYIVHVYYPRHIVFAYLTMGAAVLVWTAEER